MGDDQAEEKPLAHDQRLSDERWQYWKALPQPARTPQEVTP